MPGGLLTQGFQQPGLQIRRIPDRPPLQPQFNVEVMPNPTTAGVHILLDDGITGMVKISWHDLSGHFMEGGTCRVSQGMLECDVSGFVAGTYVLTVTAMSLPPQSFLVTKVD